MNKAAHIDGWKAQTEYAAEYSHRGCRWGLNFFAIDDADAQKRLESIQQSAELLGVVAARISLDNTTTSRLAPPAPRPDTET
jgi:hypothetical protein